MSEMITERDLVTFFGMRPTHGMTEAQWLRLRAEQYERLYTGNVDEDPVLAEEYWSTAKSLQARADELEWMAEAEAQEADYADLKQTEACARI